MSCVRCCDSVLLPVGKTYIQLHSKQQLQVPATVLSHRPTHHSYLQCTVRVPYRHVCMPPSCCCALAGGSDGGVHAWKLTQLTAAVAALGDAKQSAAAAAALSLVPMPGHVAAVMGLDYCSARHQLASASEVSGLYSWGHVYTAAAPCWHGWIIQSSAAS